MPDQITWTPIKEFKEILFTQFGGIAKISINRPQVHNAFTPLTVQEMIEAMRLCQDRTDIGVIILTGDVAFFYDRNAFWHNYALPNLRVVLFNNHGGGIFRIIDGPRQQPELEEFFETRQALTAENTAKDFNLRYFPVSSFEELEAALPVFFAAETGAALLEVFTDSKTNAAFFEEYRAAVKAAFA